MDINKLLNSSKDKIIDSWFISQRDASYKIFNELGFPTKKQDTWKYTNINEIISNNYSIPEKEKFDIFNIRRTSLDNTSASLLFCNGLYDKEFSYSRIFEDVEIKTLVSQAYGNNISFKELFDQNLLPKKDDKENSLFWLNKTLLIDGNIIRSKRKSKEWIQLSYLNSDTGWMSNNKHYISCLEGSQENIFYISKSLPNAGIYWNNNVLEITLKENSSLNLVILLNESFNAFNTLHCLFNLGENSKLNIGSIILDGSKNRLDLEIFMNGTNSECNLYGLSKTKKENSIITTIYHNADNTKSNQYYKNLNFDGVFNFIGNINIDKNKRNCSADQLVNSILIDGHCNIIPELDINNDQVNCTHGVTIGGYDKNEIDYLMTRGFTEDHSKELLNDVFLNDIVSMFPENIKQYITTYGFKND